MLFYNYRKNFELIPAKDTKHVIEDIFALAIDGTEPREYKGVTEAATLEIFEAIKRSRIYKANAKKRYDKGPEDAGTTRVSRKISSRISCCTADDKEKRREEKKRKDTIREGEGEEIDSFVPTSDVSSTQASPPSPPPPPPPPTLEEIGNYARETGSAVSPSRFYDYFSEREWKGILNWKSRFDAWGQNEFGKGERQRADSVRIEKPPASSFSLDDFDEVERAMRRKEKAAEDDTPFWM